MTKELLNFFSRRAKELKSTPGNPKVDDYEHPQEDLQGNKSLMSLRDIDNQMEDSFQRLRGVDPT